MKKSGEDIQRRSVFFFFSTFQCLTGSIVFATEQLGVGVLSHLEWRTLEQMSRRENEKGLTNFFLSSSLFSSLPNKAPAVYQRRCLFL